MHPEDMCRVVSRVIYRGYRLK